MVIRWTSGVQRSCTDEASFDEASFDAGDRGAMTTETVTRQPSYSSSMPAYTSSAAASSSSRTNPISLRIYKALGTTFDDPTTLEALQVASGYYEPAYAASISSAKGKSKAQDAAVEDDSEGDGDEDESPIFRRTLKTANAGEGSSAALARKYLKRDVEAELARGSVKFLHAFGEVDKVRPRRCRARVQALIPAAEARRAAGTYA